MKVRPTSVTVIASILVAIGVISLVGTLTMINNPQVREAMAKSPLPIPVQHVLTVVGLAVMIAAGIAMFQGFNWGRMLYTVWGVIGFIVGITTSPAKLMLIPSTILFAVFVFFLFRPKANAFFAKEPKQDDHA